MPLFKYVTFKKIDVLENAHIRFTQPLAFNDPFELFPRFVGFAPEKDVEEFTQEYFSNGSEIEKMLEESWNKEIRKYEGLNIPFSLVENLMREKFDQVKPSAMTFLNDFMSMKGPQFREMALDIIMKALNRTIGILCFSEVPDNILMWSHYASNHTGFVIEFDENQSFFGQRSKENGIRRCVRKVRYSNERPQFTFFDSSLSDDENLDRWIKDLMWVKSSDWAYERECRMIDSLRECEWVISDTDPPIYLFPIPLCCIKTIIFGCRALQNSKQKTIDLLNSKENYSHIVIQEAKIDDKEYKINIR